MASGAKPRVRVPKTASVGDTITIKTLIKHKMESGQRRDDDGNIVVTLEPSISTNPYFAFDAIVPEAGEFAFTWYDDDGSVYEAKKSIKIA